MHPVTAKEAITRSLKYKIVDVISCHMIVHPITTTKRDLVLTPDRSYVAKCYKQANSARSKGLKLQKCAAQAAGSQSSDGVYPSA